jgi:hypothetical protein
VKGTDPWLSKVARATNCQPLTQIAPGCSARVVGGCDGGGEVDFTCDACPETLQLEVGDASGSFT